MAKIEKADWTFIISATSVWVLSLLITAWDFVWLQDALFRFNIESVLGLALFVSGVLLRIVSKRTLRRSYSYVLKREKKELVTFGIYRFIRHPIYLAAVLYGLGLPLIFSSFYGFLIALAFIPCLLYRIRIEERMLIEQFGEQYIDYKKHTKKLFPYIY